ncbi:MAG: hypothetical protein KAH32_01270 [Chlamydiia bacterium]|nr:hypothetical protein [Chlamydiia bacterium]
MFSIFLTPTLGAAALVLAAVPFAKPAFECAKTACGITQSAINANPIVKTVKSFCSPWEMLGSIGKSIAEATPLYACIFLVGIVCASFFFIKNRYNSKDRSTHPVIVNNNFFAEEIEDSDPVYGFSRGLTYSTIRKAPLRNIYRSRTR